MASKKRGNSKKTFLFFGLVVLALIVFGGSLQVLYKRIQLINFYSKLTNFERNQNWEGLYNLLSSEQRRKTSLNDFLLLRNGSTKPISSEYTVHSYEVKGDRGIIDRTLIVCYSTVCSGSDRFEQRAKKEYLYVNGRWYVPENNTVFCERDRPYVLPPEFDRVLSLIIQRLDNSQYLQGTTFEEEDRSNVNLIKELRNCFNIQYASSESDLGGAEGVFYFDRNSSNEDLVILVSPNYKIKDDLLTATLLRHELQHAMYHATGSDKTMPCFENEADAFAFEIGFYLGALNQEERNSIIGRYYSSPEAKNIVDLSNYVLRSGKKTYDEATLQYVENSPYYQNECR